jgi:hypothetical protein
VTSFLDQHVLKIEDADFRQLIIEMLNAVGWSEDTDLARFNFVPFLVNCQYPQGAGTKRVPFDRRYTVPGYLETKLGKISSPSILRLCQELAVINGDDLEMISGKTLMSFLNSIVLNFEKRDRARAARERKRRAW